MGAPASVEELEVEDERFAGSRQTDRKPLRHAVEEQRLFAFDADRFPDPLARPRWNEDLGLEPGSDDQR
jgi:hypothetical protein